MLTKNFSKTTNFSKRFEESAAVLSRQEEVKDAQSARFSNSLPINVTFR